MLNQLVLSGLDFAVYVFGALVFFATGWLHLDSWTVDKKEKALLLRSVGFFLLALVFIAKATTNETDPFLFATSAIKILGLSIILVGILTEPILKPPSKAPIVIPFLLISKYYIPITAFLLLLVSITYLKKATKGYEKQIKPLFWAFLLFFISEAIGILFIAANTNTLFLSELLKKYGAIRNLSLLINFVGFCVLGLWTWGYLRFRAKTQLFIVFVASSLLIFTATTLTFTFLLFVNFQKDAFSHLRKDVKVLNYAIDEIKSKSLINTQAVSENIAIKNAIYTSDYESIYENSLNFMLSQNASFLVITDQNGQVVVRAEDNENVGESLSDSLLFKNALNGNSSTTIAVKETSIVPLVQIQASSPIFDDQNQVTAVVVSGYNIDSAFVDGIKNATELDVSVFAGNIRSATTFLAPDGKTRFIGTQESNTNILETVFDRKELYVGPAQILNQPFYVAYAPLVSAEDEVIGMLSVGSLQKELMETVETSIQHTFLISIVLMLISIIPSYLISYYIKENISA